jgi:hypothetical protein
MGAVCIVQASIIVDRTRLGVSIAQFGARRLAIDALTPVLRVGEALNPHPFLQADAESPHKDGVFG